MKNEKKSKHVKVRLPNQTESLKLIKILNILNIQCQKENQ